MKKVSKNFEKVLGIFINILTVIVALMILIIFYGKMEMNANHRNYANYFGYTVFRVTSGSMGKTIEVNDVILVKLTKNFQENDIITFTSGDTFITHRVKNIKDGIIVTKGDANNTNDVSITKDKVLGVVVYDFKGLELWKKVLSTPKVLVSILLTLVLFDLALSYKSKKDREEQIEEVKKDSSKISTRIKRIIKEKNMDIDDYFK